MTNNGTTEAKMTATMTTKQERDWNLGFDAGARDAESVSRHAARAMLDATDWQLARIDRGESAARVLGAGGMDEHFARGRAAGLRRFLLSSASRPEAR